MSTIDSYRNSLYTGNCLLVEDRATLRSDLSATSRRGYGVARPPTGSVVGSLRVPLRSHFVVNVYNFWRRGEGMYVTITEAVQWLTGTFFLGAAAGFALCFWVVFREVAKK